MSIHIFMIGFATKKRKYHCWLCLQEFDTRHTETRGASRIRTSSVGNTVQRAVWRWTGWTLGTSADVTVWTPSLWKHRRKTSSSNRGLPEVTTVANMVKQANRGPHVALLSSCDSTLKVPKQTDNTGQGLICK